MFCNSALAFSLSARRGALGNYLKLKALHPSLSGISSRRRRSDIPPRLRRDPRKNPSLSGIWAVGPHPCPACGGALQMKKENQRSSKLGADFLFLFAEREGFEPPEPFSSTVFKTAVIDHSTTSPSAENLQNPVWDCKDIHILCICKNKFVFSHQIDLCRKRAGRRADCWRHSCRGWECH